MKLFFFSFEVSKHLNILVLPLPINLQVSLQFGTEKDLKWQSLKKERIVGYKREYFQTQFSLLKNSVAVESFNTLFYFFICCKSKRSQDNLGIQLKNCLSKMVKK